MNQRIMIASVIILGAAIAFAETPQLEQQLKELSRAPVDYALAGKWFKLAKEIPDDGQRQEALMATAAALLYSQKADVYQKSVRTQINDAAAFEDEFLQECPLCQGEGESRRQCPVCKGTGRCPYANCQDGMHRIHQINGDRYEPCRECKGSGQCQKCKGEGTLDGKCVRCGGRGKSMDKELVIAAYKRHANNATQLAQEERERKERARREAEEKKRIEEERLARERERKERERREAEEKARIEAESKEQERKREEMRRTEEEKTGEKHVQGFEKMDDLERQEVEKVGDAHEKHCAKDEDVKQDDSDNAFDDFENLYAEALEAMVDNDGECVDAIKAFKGFLNAEKHGYKQAEIAIAHMCWTMADDEKAKLKAEGISIPIIYNVNWRHAIQVFDSRLAKCELGLFQMQRARGNFGSGLRKEGLELVRQAAKEDCYCAKLFMNQLAEHTANSGMSTDSIIEILVSNVKMMSLFQKVCAIELKKDYQDQRRDRLIKRREELQKLKK